MTQQYRGAVCKPAASIFRYGIGVFCISQKSTFEAEKVAYVNDETTPKFKRRVVGAIQAGGEAAIEEFLANPYVNVGKAIVKGWMKPE